VAETVARVFQQNVVNRPTAAAAPAGGPKLLDWMRDAVRSRHYSRRTEQTYCHWVKRFCHFHNLRHPDASEINAFLTHLAKPESTRYSSIDRSEMRPREHHSGKRLVVSGTAQHWVAADVAPLRSATRLNPTVGREERKTKP